MSTYRYEGVDRNRGKWRFKEDTTRYIVDPVLIRTPFLRRSHLTLATDFSVEIENSNMGKNPTHLSQQFVRCDDIGKAFTVQIHAMRMSLATCIVID